LVTSLLALFGPSSTQKKFKDLKMNMFGYVMAVVSGLLIFVCAKIFGLDCDSLFTIVTYMLLVQFICAQMEK
jgi:hypothetical protein